MGTIFLDLQNTRSFCYELYPNKNYEIIKNIIISILEEKETNTKSS